MARYLASLYGPAQVATGPTTVYTVPAARSALMRHIHLSNPSGSAVTFTMSIGADAAGTRIFGALSIAANTVADYWGMWFMPTGTVVTVSAGTNNILVLTINGEETLLG